MAAVLIYIAHGRVKLHRSKQRLCHRAGFQDGLIIVIAILALRPIGLVKVKLHQAGIGFALHVVGQEKFLLHFDTDVGIVRTGVLNLNDFGDVRPGHDAADPLLGEGRCLFFIGPFLKLDINIAGRDNIVDGILVRKKRQRPTGQ